MGGVGWDRTLASNTGHSIPGLLGHWLSDTKTVPEHRPSVPTQHKTGLPLET